MHKELSPPEDMKLSEVLFTKALLLKTPISGKIERTGLQIKRQTRKW
jgi:hypothetical protein